MGMSCFTLFLMVFEMRRMAVKILFCAFILLLFAEARALDKIPVFVSISPQKYFVQKVGGDLVDVSVMVRSGTDAHTFEPKPQQMTALSKAKIYYSVGIEFEQVWLKRFQAANPRLLIIMTDSGIKKIPMSKFNDHQHESKPSHRNSSLDPHVWLSPPLVVIQAHNIRDGLISVDPDNAHIYKANCDRFVGEINDLDTELKRVFGDRKDLQFMVFHPSWGYFAHAYRIRQVPVELEGKAPKPAELQHLIQYAREHEIKVIFVQPQFSTSSAKVIAKAIDGQIAFVDPLAENWAENLREVARKFDAALREVKK
jgi:zinc transport system substrate-binding protein